MKRLSGQCLCGDVSFTCEDNFDEFHLCHCIQCQKTSGSAHVANLFTHRNNIAWLSGKERVSKFDVPGRNISTAFCSKCGSPVPYLTQDSMTLIVPAGCLDTPPTMKPQDMIFWHERASWYEAGIESSKFDGFPT